MEVLLLTASPAPISHSCCVVPSSVAIWRSSCIHSLPVGRSHGKATSAYPHCGPTTSIQSGKIPSYTAGSTRLRSRQDIRKQESLFMGHGLLCFVIHSQYPMLKGPLLPQVELPPMHEERFMQCSLTTVPHPDLQDSTTALESLA
jgi:hypothetical protein